MSKRNSNRVKFVVALAAMILAISVTFNRQSSFAAEQYLPEGKGVEIARDKCVVCHEADVIRGQRLSKAGWTREVEKMIRWGASVNDAEKAILVDYFSAHFTPVKSDESIAANVDQGKQVFENKCTVCHETDVTEGQRLTRPGWTREVEKMVRWGATVTDAEKPLLVDYLLKNYGPRPFVPTK